MKNLPRYKYQRSLRAVKALAVLAGLFLVIFSGSALAHHTSKEIIEQEQKLDRLQAENYTVRNRLNSITASIRSLEAQIKDTNEHLALTQSEIERLTNEIARQKEMLAELMRQLYTEGQTSALEMLASSEDFEEFINKTGHLDQVQENVQIILDKVSKAKADLESKKSELESLNKQLNAQKTALSAQLAEQQRLLRQNQSQILVTQEKLEELYRAQASLEASICANQYPKSGKFVRAGTVVGYQGNTGASSGSHLHFGVSSGGNCVDPLHYIGSGMIIPLQGCPSAHRYRPSGCLTQGFGRTSFNPNHTGIDLAMGYGTPVLAAEDGYITVPYGRDRTISSACHPQQDNTFPNANSGCYVVMWHPGSRTYSRYVHLGGFGDNT